MNIPLTRELIKEQAKQLHAYLSHNYPECKLSHCYEALAKIYKFQNWNTLSAFISAKGANNRI